jgi:predicted transposase YdaD
VAAKGNYMHHFDVVLKVLLRNSMARITGKRVLRWLATELPKIQDLSVDLLGETADGELMQIEVQSFNQKNMPFRMLRYLSLIIAIHHRIPQQILLYVGRKPLDMEDHFAWADGEIRYAILDMRDVDGDPLLASPDPSDNVLAIVARLRDSNVAVRSILEKLSRLPRDDAKEYYQALLILSGLRGLAKTVHQEAHTMLAIDLSENEILGPAYVRGREEGQHDGRVASLREQIEQRLGSVPEWVEQTLSSSSTEELKAIGLRVLNAASFEDLFG